MFIKSTDSQIEMLKLFSNFFNGEIKDLFIRQGVEELFYSLERKIQHVFNFNDYKMLNYGGGNFINKKLLHCILNLEFSYEMIFNSTDKFCEIEDKPLIKSMFIQSILRIVFSEEKYKFLENQSLQYEILFLTNVIKKCIHYYYDNFGEKYTDLFRREEIFDDIIKYIFFTFGNSFYYKSCFIPFKELIEKYDRGEGSSLYMTHEEFFSFYEDFLQKIKLFCPNVLKILLKIIYNKVLEVYKISPDNYSPIMTILFFNFFINPKMQDIYDIGPIKNSFILTINKLLKNISFGILFKDDPLEHYNEIIEICQLHLKSTIEKILSSLVTDDMDYIIKNEFFGNSKYVSFPDYFFYYDCDYIFNILENSICKTELSELSTEVTCEERKMKYSKI
jgi:hypothetical protein